MRSAPTLLLAVLVAAACSEAESDAEVAVVWAHPGRCSDIGADAFRLTTGGGEEDGERLDVPCEDEGLTLPFPLGTMVALSGELVFEDEPITETLGGSEFRVERAGVGVTFTFELEDFQKTADYRFKAVYRRPVNDMLMDVDCTILTGQRVTVRHRQGGAIVEGAEVCGPDDVCTPADGSLGPCRGRDDQQTVPGLDWGRYLLHVAGVGTGTCYSREVEISVGFAERVDEIVADQELPCE